MKQNFKLKEVLEFGNKIREYCMKGCADDTVHKVFYEFDKFCEENLSGHKNRKSFVKYSLPENTKLTVEQVKEIKQLLATKHPQIIADNYMVSLSCINNIKYNRTWKDAK
jgi:hypothetical protein